MRYFLLLVLLTGMYANGSAQGCVAIRSNGSTCTMTGAHEEDQHRWALGLNHRYFRSFRHFVKDEEQKHRVEQGTEVINISNVFDIGLTRTLNSRWSLALFLPIINNTRTSLYEHNGTNRYATRSFGLGDVRIAAYRWLRDPLKPARWNVQGGLGIKLPTGDYRYQDLFYRNDSTYVLGPVDQSIQLGDGGTGITVEANAFYHFARKAGLYANAFYLLNPREHNGVSTARGGTPSAASLAYRSSVMSVPDQYMVRAGANFRTGKWTLSGGLRMECVPAEDLVGGSNGFRRPGYVLSAEPVAAYKTRAAQLYVSVPYAVERSRTQSVPDKIRSAKTGVPFTGDAAFADYSINVGVSFALK